MKYENGEISGDLVVEQDSTLNGMVNGNVTVKPNVSLVLNGICIGDLTLESNSDVDVSGIVQGNINNTGGTLKINGIVQGDIADAGSTVVSEGARVNGEIKKVSSSSTSIIAGTVGGAIIGNMLIPGIGAAIVGGVLGALLGSESSSKEKPDE